MYRELQSARSRSRRRRSRYFVTPPVSPLCPPPRAVLVYRARTLVPSRSRVPSAPRAVLGPRNGCDVFWWPRMRRTRRNFYSSSPPAARPCDSRLTDLEFWCAIVAVLAYPGFFRGWGCGENNIFAKILFLRPRYRRFNWTRN